MPSHTMWMFTIGAGKRDKAEIVFLRACRQQARDPDFVACLSGKGGRSSETNRWMGTWGWDKTKVCRNFMPVAQMSGIQTPVSTQRWDGIPVIAVPGINSMTYLKQKSERSQKSHWPFFHCMRSYKNKAFILQTPIKTTSHRGRERWKKIESVITYPKFT